MTGVDLATLRAQRFSRWERVWMDDGEMSLVEVDATPEVLALVEAVEAACSFWYDTSTGDGELSRRLSIALAPFRREQP